MTSPFSPRRPRRGLAACALLLATGVVHAEALQLGDGLELRHKLTLGYAAALRTEKPADGLVDGPVDPATGLPTTINFDDGNRNFRRGSLINNRVSALGELVLEGPDYGAVLSGSAFYDRVYLEANDNDSPDTVNKSGAHDEFTRSARERLGRRARLLDAYVHYDWSLDDGRYLGLRLGQHVVSWGESLFFSGIALAQGAADATKANVPGVEIKDILLPSKQVSLQFGISDALQLLAYYKFEFQEFEINPVGDFFSPADVIGPGAEFIYGAQNPLYPALGTLVPGTPRNINVRYDGAIDPGSDGQYGLGLKFDLTDVTGLGLYYLRYTNGIPTLRFNDGYPVLLPPLVDLPPPVQQQAQTQLAAMGLGVPGLTEPVTTQAVGQSAPVSYNAVYFDDIALYGLSFSTLLGDVNVAGELVYRDGVDMMVAGSIPTASRGRALQLDLNAIYATGPTLFWDALAVVVDVNALHVTDVDAVDGRDELVNTRDAWAFQVMAIPEFKSLRPGWDLAVPMVVGGVPQGTPAVAGGFGALLGEGDYRASLGLTLSRLQTLQFGVAYNAYFGDPDLGRRLYVDRDHVAFSIKYQF